jgi:hypothetical protein
MKKLALLFSVLFAVICHAATTEKPISLSCRSAHLDPIFYEASLQGPDKNRFYKLKFSYQYYGAVLKYHYDLKKINKSFIGQKARVYNLTPQINKTIRLYVETDKDGPIDMICK